MIPKVIREWWNNLRRVDFMLFTSVAIIICYGIYIVVNQNNIATPKAIKKAKFQMEKFKAWSKVPPPIGECWKSALNGLPTSCPSYSKWILLDDYDYEKKHRLALEFTSCFNQLTQLPPIVCGEEVEVDSCIEALDKISAKTYSDFLSHQIDLVCTYFGESEAEIRSNASTMVKSNLNEQKLEPQENSEKSGILKALIRVCTLMEKVFDRLRVWTRSIRKSYYRFCKVFIKGPNLNLWFGIPNDLAVIDMMFFYFVAMYLKIFATTTVWTRSVRGARAGGLMFGSIACELTFYSYSDFSPEETHEWIWIIRRMFAGCCVLRLIWSVVTFQEPDPTKPVRIPIPSRNPTLAVCIALLSLFVVFGFCF